MNSAPFLILCCGLLLAPLYPRAQATGDWSAIEVGGAARSAASRPVTSTPTLMPYATQPATGQHAKGEAQPIMGALDRLLKLRAVRFTYLPGQGENAPQYGLVPGELAKVFPELVKTDLLTGQQTITTSQLTPLLLEALREQQRQLATLQAQQLQLAQAYAKLVEQNGSRLRGQRLPVLASPATLTDSLSASR